MMGNHELQWPGGLVAVTGLLLLAACGPPKPATPPPVPNAALQEQVMATERAFAATMAQRNREAFAGFLDPETIFYSGRDVLRGREQVTTSWSSYFEGSEAPFSWEPDSVQVLDSGTLALSTGPVRDPSGRIIARFNSIWRRNAAGEWKIIFDKGSPP
jgi:ketosteroid isomerase-like protein